MSRTTILTDKERDERKSRLKRSGSLRLSTRTLNRYEGAFSLFDKNNDGGINGDDFKYVLEQLGEQPDDEDIKETLEKIGGEGNVTFNDFVYAMSERMAPEEQEDELRETFNAFDRNRDGFLDKEELKYVLKTFLNEELTDQELTETMSLGDKSGKGKLNFEDFKRLIMDIS